MSDCILVTGCSGGIGSAIVEDLIHAGWRVLGIDISDPPQSLRQDESFIFIRYDLQSIGSCHQDIQTLFELVEDALQESGLYALINNAALQELKCFEELDLSDWHRTFGVNLFAPIQLSRVFLNLLAKSNGTIINISSVHSSLTKPHFSAYSTSKAALSSLTRSLAVELGDRIRVNAIEPAAISTSMLEAGFIGQHQKRLLLESYHPSKCIGEPSEISRTILFLLDHQNKFLNGCIIELTGGIHARLHDPS